MKKVLALLLFAGVFAGPGLVPAQETPEVQMEFVDRLRKQGLADLALEYIEKLQKNPPPQLAPILPLEAARKMGLNLEKGDPIDA